MDYTSSLQADQRGQPEYRPRCGGGSMRTSTCFPMVSARGFEPPRPFGHQLLRLARLPFRHADDDHLRFSIGTGSIRSAGSMPNTREKKYCSPSMVRLMFFSWRNPCCSPSYATYA